VEAAVRVGVVVTFLRMERGPVGPAPGLPGGTGLVRVSAPTVPFYRYLYATVGGAYCWWLRRAMSDAALAAVLADPAVSLHVLYEGGEPAGFFELEARGAEVNLSYFGLMPHAVGRGWGRAFLRAAVDEGWSRRPRAMTVNTCTADHPRALPGYLATGFEPVRRVREVWDVPLRLGLQIPEHLRV
jgi:GNAT superfamily N-acetyltransferase